LYLTRVCCGDVHISSTDFGMLAGGHKLQCEANLQVARHVHQAFHNAAVSLARTADVIILHREQQNQQ
jgi:hypothetical protein